MKKRLLSLLCVLVLTVSVIPAASALEGEAARAADTLSTLGLIDSTYNLDAPATRAQAAVLLVHLAGAEQAAAADNWLAGFRDVPASIAQEVNYAARQGWITGVTATAFRPDAALTANAWSAFLLRMLGYSDKAGIFADVKRPKDGGKGLAGVVVKDDRYFNPFIEAMKGRVAE